MSQKTCPSPGFRLLYFSPVYRQSYAQRPHYFVKHFQERTGGEVLWVNPYVSRLPQWTDLKQRPSLHDQQTDAVPGLAVKSALALPVEPLPGGTWVNDLLFWRTLRKAWRSFAAEGNLVVGVGKPTRMALLALEELNPCHSFYDAMDNFPDFHSGLSRRAMEKTELEILRLVDALYVSSACIEERLGPRHSRVVRIANAYDMGTVSLPPERGPGLRAFGYIGSMASWFDWTAVFSLARAFPDWTVHLVGPVFQKPRASLPDNVVMHAPCPQEEVGRHLARFSIGLIPFRLSPLTRGVDPIKYYEYRAYGLPVLSTRFGEMARRGREEGVFFFDGKDDLRQVVSEALAHAPDGEAVKRFQERNDWTFRLEQAGVFSDLPSSAC